MDTFVQRFQPEKYEAWITGTDFGKHPEEPESKPTATPMPTF